MAPVSSRTSSSKRRAGKNLVWHYGHVSLGDRRRLLGGDNKVLWLTGLSGSGKSAIAAVLERELYALGIPCYVLDGDNIRHGLSSDLGFSDRDKQENLRRMAEVARMFHDAGLYVITCIISPYRRGRALARKLIGEDFVEVFVDCPLAECERRDVKGFYAKAKQGDIPDFIGVHTIYEKPVSPDIHLKTDRDDVAVCVEKTLAYLGLTTARSAVRKHVRPRGNADKRGSYPSARKP